ncbi:MAG TPA: hypothetical protein PLC40_19800, partial [Candidatus Hydrogenedentes bacterium]|nr:hypothetical protein [Candidatus Hydrogenedentota bacterium]
AETLSKSLSDTEKTRLGQAYGRSEVYSLAQLESNQVASFNPEALRLAYLQSHASIDFLWRRFGHSKMMSFLRALRSGTSGEAALQSVYRRNYARLEQDVAVSCN